MAWDYPSVEPPQYLQQLSPELYRQECQRGHVRCLYDEAIELHQLGQPSIARGSHVEPDVNRQPATADQVLAEQDRVSFTPTKIEGA